MDKYLLGLQKELENVNAENIEEILDYFTEMISDRLENGEDIETILNELGDPKTLASNFASGEVKTKTVSDNQHLVYDELKDLVVDVNNYDVKIVKHDSNEVIVDFEERGNVSLDCDYHNGKLHIEQKGMSFDLGKFFNFSNHKSISLPLTVYVPNSYRNNVDIESVNGLIQISDLELDKVEIENVNGDVNLNNLIANQLEYDGVNADIDIVDCSIKHLYMETVNGDIQMDRIGFKRIDIETVNGDCEIAALASKEEVSVNIEKLFRNNRQKGAGDKQINFESVNGDIKIEYLM